MSDLLLAPEITVSYSQIQAWLRCRFAWHVGYTLGYEPVKKSANLDLGSLVHEILEDHYRGKKDKRAGDPKEWMLAVVQPYLAGGKYNLVTIKSALALCEKYIVDYAPYEDLGYEVVAVEQHYEIMLTTPKGRKFAIQCYIDLILRHIDTGQLWLVDHKTVGNGSFYSTIQVMMDAQMPYYAAILRELDINIFGIMFNMLNTYQYKDMAKQPVEKFFKRAVTHRTQKELDTIMLEIGNIVDDMIDNAAKPFRSLNKDCSWCRFQEPCLLNMKGIPLEVVLEDGFQKKTPKGDKGSGSPQEESSKEDRLIL